MENLFGDTPVEDPVESGPTVRMATPRQEEYISKLLAKKEWEHLPKRIHALASVEVHTFDEAREMIDALKSCNWKDTDPPEGIHFLNGTVFKVQVAHQGSGRKYAKRLFVGKDPEETHWDYIGRAGEFELLSESTLMSLKEAKKFGQLYGVCCVCGAVLTDEVSIERGIGPICERKGF